MVTSFNYLVANDARHLSRYAEASGNRNSENGVLIARYILSSQGNLLAVKLPGFRIHAASEPPAEISSTGSVAMFSKDDVRKDGAITKSGAARGDWLVMSAIFVGFVVET